ncbi:ATP-binding cassette domain-containing protein [Candidatus Aalborgicola defluviihabitans]|uniref:ATP-binding cassette domain-containing protein n=1 Tax=Candidatus Aalborgicola defluviihabitans TaxID=3386187 RepID=UPI0039B8220C
MADSGSRTDVEPGRLVLEGVSFSYPGHQALALDAVSLQLPPGQTLGLVGATGSGKSSVLRLILRQYTQSTGTIRWGGNSLGDYTLEALNRAISWVPRAVFILGQHCREHRLSQGGRYTRRNCPRRALGLHP